MTAVTELGYLGIAARDLDAWRDYATTSLGLQSVKADADGALRLRMDGRHHRFALHQSDEETVAYAGWQVEDATALETIAARLEAAGVPVSLGTAEQLEARRVAGLISFNDPNGYRCEVFWGPQDESRSDAGFVTGNQGLGHFVLMCSNLDQTIAFYTDLLGLKVSDYIEPPGSGLRAGFLRCNSRHHSIAFFERAGAPMGINHFMIQRQELNDVGRAYDDVQKANVPLITTLGRHSNDLMLSFYMRNPSGWGVEYGWGGREIDDSSWCVEHLQSGTLWGHQRMSAS